jgi:hypothetical protein
MNQSSAESENSNQRKAAEKKPIFRNFKAAFAMIKLGRKRVLTFPLFD